MGTHIHFFYAFFRCILMYSMQLKFLPIFFSLIFCREIFMNDFFPFFFNLTLSIFLNAKNKIYIFIFHPIAMRTEVQWVQWCAVCVWLYEPRECSIYLHMMTFYCSAAEILNNKINTFIHEDTQGKDWTRNSAANECYFSQNDQTTLECMKKDIEALFFWQHITM